MTPLDLNTSRMLHNKQHEHILPEEKHLLVSNYSSTLPTPAIDCNPSTHSHPIEG